MSHVISSSRMLGRGMMLPFMALAATLSASLCLAETVTLNPGESIQAAVSAHPAGTNFVLKAGTYRLQSVVPLNNDSFIGQGSVILDGATVLNFAADPSGSGLWVANATYIKETRGVCDSDHPLCMQDQDVFIDSVLQTPATSAAGLVAGSWYFDQANGKVYLPVNPSGHLIEMSTASVAFSGKATGVKISHLTVEKYITLAEAGAIGGVENGAGWSVNDVESCWNHGTGVALGTNSQLSNSFIHNNGETGIKFGGSNGKAIGNEISWNNYAGFSTIWEAGGSKFWATTNLLIQSNYVHDNNGKGLWTDTDNVGTSYISNTVLNNSGVGIQHEVSYAAVIRNNIVEGNAPAPTTWLGNAQIRIMNSSNVEVYNNTVETAVSGGNGIAVYNQDRGSGTLGLWVSANDYVHNNNVTYLGVNGESGFQNDGNISQATGNRFDYNSYTLAAGGTAHWFWYGWATWSYFHQQGQELHGHTKL